VIVRGGFVSVGIVVLPILREGLRGARLSLSDASMSFVGTPEARRARISPAGMSSTDSRV
jgi:hypothetical protein